MGERNCAYCKAKDCGRAGHNYPIDSSFECFVAITNADRSPADGGDGEALIEVYGPVEPLHREMIGNLLVSAIEGRTDGPHGKLEKAVFDGDTISLAFTKIPLSEEIKAMFEFGGDGDG